MDIKHYLNLAFMLDERIKDKKERIEEFEQLALISAVDYSKERVQSSHSLEAPFEKQIERVADLQEELKREMASLVELKFKIERMINSIEDDKCQLVLSKRYVLCKKWETIADEMGYTTRQIYKFHGRGLEELRRKYKEIEIVH